MLFKIIWKHELDCFQEFRSRRLRQAPSGCLFWMQTIGDGGLECFVSIVFVVFPSHKPGLFPFLWESSVASSADA